MIRLAFSFTTKEIAMSYTHLSEKERYHIELEIKKGISQKDIAETLGRHPSTISREIKRNTGKRGYRHKQAGRQAKQRHKDKAKAIKLTDEVIVDITTLLKQQLSPEQICGYLKIHKGILLHHETIYRFIYEDKEAGGELYQHLRIASNSYRKRRGSNYSRRGKIPNRVSIHNRPSIIDEKTRIGDIEGDTIIGKNRQSALLTLVDRNTLYTEIVKLEGKQADKLAKSAIQRFEPIKDRLHSLTLDNGLEFAKHEDIADALGLDTYFADPYASWQRGINENTNGLIRQYFPKGTDFNDVSVEQIQFVQDRLNNRPRKSRGFKTPNELFFGKSIDLLVA